MLVTRPTLRKTKKPTSFETYSRQHKSNDDQAVTIGYIREFLKNKTDLETLHSRYKGTDKSVFEKMLENMCRVASSPTHPLSVSAFNAIMDRAFGKAKPSDAELGAIKGQVTFQVVQMTQSQQDPEIPVEEQKALKPVPEFIESEVVEDE